MFFPAMDEEAYITIMDYSIEDHNDVFNFSLCPPTNSNITMDEMNMKNEDGESTLMDSKFILEDKAPEENICKKKGHLIPSLIITLPSKETDVSYSTPFQFDRQAPARISTSPTLRRLRKHTVGNFMSLQDYFDASKFPTHKEESVSVSSSEHLEKNAASIAESGCKSTPVFSSQDNGSCVSQSLNHTNDPLGKPGLQSDYTDDEKSPNPSYNGTSEDTEGLHSCSEVSYVYYFKDLIYN